MKQCAICGKGSIIAVKRKKLRGNWNPVNVLRKQPNLQKMTYQGIKVLACTRCIKKSAKS